MANVKISQLPEYTGNTHQTWFVINDSGETTTYKIQKQDIFATAGFSWQNGSPAYFNLTNGADNYIPFNTQIFNTNTNAIALFNPGSTSGTSGNQGARIYIQQPGIYSISCQIHIFDVTGNADYLVKLSSASTSGGTMTALTLLADIRSAETSTDQILNGTYIFEVTTPTFYGVAINPSANSPFPSDANDTPTRIFIQKIN